MPERLSIQEHPMGRVELSSDRSYVARHRRREFASGRIDELFHHNSAVDGRYVARSEKTTPELPADLSAVATDYAGRQLLTLPDPEPLDARLDSLLDGRRSRRSFADRGVSRTELATVLGHGAGVTDTASNGRAVETFRSYPSAGGLFPVEIYPVVLGGRDITSGRYYYTPRDHALRVFDDSTDTERFQSAFVDATFSREIVDDAPVVFVLTVSLPRIRVKYGPIGYRFALLEAGHVAQNLLLAAEGAGMGGVPVGSFFGDTLDDFLGVDGVNESAVYTLAVGHGENDE